jgi:glycosyltransferase involved in cell wall biosynthesis
MRILQASYAYAPYFERGGPPRKVTALTEELARRGHHVTVLTCDHGPRAPSADRRDDVRVVYLPTLIRVRNGVTVNPTVLRTGRRLVAASEVVHIYGLYDLLGAAVARQCRTLGVPYVAEPMGSHRPIVRSLRKKRLYHRLVGRALMDGAAAVVATSPLERDELVADGVARDRIVIRRNPVDVSDLTRAEAGSFRARHGIRAGELIVLYLGRLAPKKRPELLVDAMTRLPPGTRLAFVGPDEDGTRARLESQASRLGVADQVLFTGPLYGADRGGALLDADVFALPSQNENFGNAIVEAMAAGTPAVVTDRCGAASLVDGRGALVVSGELNAFVDALDRLLTDHTERARLSVEAERAAAQIASVDEPTGILRTSTAR